MTSAEQVQWLFDVEQIKQLKHRYCAYCDDSYNPKGIGSLFTENGVWDGGVFGRAETRAGNRRFGKLSAMFNSPLLVIPLHKVLHRRFITIGLSSIGWMLNITRGR